MHLEDLINNINFILKNYDKKLLIDAASELKDKIFELPFNVQTDSIYQSCLKIASIAYDAGLHDGYLKIDDSEHQEHGSAAGNPKAWYLLDKNGKKIHFGDIIKNDRYEGFYEVTGLGEYSVGLWTTNSNFHWVSPEDCEKVTPDTKEKIIDDLADAFGDVGDSGYQEEAAKFYDRIAAQVKAEVE